MRRDHCLFLLPLFAFGCGAQRRSGPGAGADDQEHGPAAPVECTVQGPIAEKYRALGAEASLLGKCVTSEAATADGAGRFNRFEGGSIYWTPGTGAHEVHGAIHDRWAALSWEAGVLGYPVSDEDG